MSVVFFFRFRIHISTVYNTKLKQKPRKEKRTKQMNSPIFIPNAFTHSELYRFFINFIYSSLVTIVFWSKMQ